MKRLAWSVFIIFATLTMALVMWEFRSAIVLLIFSLVIAATVRPMVDWITARRLPRGLALLLTYLICVGVLIIVGLTLGGLLLTDIQQLTKDMTSGYEQLRIQWPNGTPFQQSLARRLPSAVDLYATLTGKQGDQLLQSGLGLTLGSLDLIGQFLIVIILSMYWSADQEHFKRVWLSLLPFGIRSSARDVWQNIETGLGAYLRSQLIQSVLALVALGIGFYLLGLRYAIALAVIGAIGWLIPWIGVFLAVIPTTLVAFSISPVVGILAAVFTISVLFFLEYVIEPRLFNRRRFSSLLAAILVLILVQQYGLIGIIIAPPVAAVIQILGTQLLRSPKTLEMPAAPFLVGDLTTRLDAVEAQLVIEDNSITPKLRNLIDRLTQLIARASEK